ncbi:hypothetical protein ACVW0I_005262 [Bradyrhizobium sp. LM6.11]
MDVKEVRKLDAYLKRVFGNSKIRVVPRPKKDDSAEVYIGEEFIGVLFVDDEDDDRSFPIPDGDPRGRSRRSGIVATTSVSPAARATAR